MTYLSSNATISEGDQIQRNWTLFLIISNLRMGKLRFCEKGFKKLKHVLAGEICNDICFSDRKIW